MARYRAPVLYTDDSPDEPTRLPYRFEICSCCDGHGRSSAYLGAFTRDDLDQEGPEFIETYMSGGYDRACEPCDGTGKVQVADYARMTPDQVKAWEAQCEDDDAIDAEREAERRMGC